MRSKSHPHRLLPLADLQTQGAGRVRSSPSSAIQPRHATLAVGFLLRPLTFIVAGSVRNQSGRCLRAPGGIRQVCRFRGEGDPGFWAQAQLVVSYKGRGPGRLALQGDSIGAHLSYAPRFPARHVLKKSKLFDHSQGRKAFPRSMAVSPG